MEVSIRIHGSEGQTFLLNPQKIRRAAIDFGLDDVIPGRYSSLFVADLLLLSAQGIDPYHIVREIKALEGGTPESGTKPATKFTRPTLKGLWHKHFFAPLPSVFAHNILNQFGENGIADLVNEIFDPSKNSVVTQQMIDELAHRATVEPYEKRYDAGKLTGEWIVFGKHDDINYYLRML